MAKIEIKGSPEELERASVFLRNNNIRFRIVADYGNHSERDTRKYVELITQNVYLNDGQGQ